MSETTKLDHYKFISPREKSIISGFESRFNSRPELHEGIDWERIKYALEEVPRAIDFLEKTEAEGHEPNVYNADEEGFDIGTCSYAIPKSTRRCMVSEEGRASFTGSLGIKRSAVPLVIDFIGRFGGSLMTSKQLETLYSKAVFDGNTTTWMQNPPGFPRFSYGEDAYRARYSDGFRGNVRYLATREVHTTSDIGCRFTYRVLWADVAHAKFEAARKPEEIKPATAPNITVSTNEDQKKEPNKLRGYTRGLFGAIEWQE